MTCVKLSTVWAEFGIVPQGDLFLSNKEHTRFPSILWGWGWGAGEAAGRSGAGPCVWGRVVGLEVSGGITDS